jgi:cytochrome c biogenesis protein CcmG, thiol:disulfide interchange protein DsbE
MRTVKTDRLLGLLICVLLGGLVCAIYAGIHERVIVDGDTAPNFTITADNGRTVTLPHFGGKLLVVNFWATWCAPCVEETPSLSRFAQRYADKGVVVLAISVDQSEKAYRKFLDKYKPAFLTVRERKLHEEFGTYMWPESYIIGADGKVLKKIAQGVDWMEPSTIQFVDGLLQTQ